jgi:hypothetical protein
MNYRAMICDPLQATAAGSLLAGANRPQTWRMKQMSTETPATKRVLATVQLAPQVMEAVDQLAARQFKTRSEFVRQSILAELERQGVVPLRAA